MVSEGYALCRDEIREVTKGRADNAALLRDR